MTTAEFLKIEAGIEKVRSGPNYKPNPVIEDFWRLIEAYRELLLEREAAADRQA
jgi:hypothetical protein